MKHLKELYAHGFCGIGDDGIKDCDLVKLYACDNNKITKNGVKTHDKFNTFPTVI